MIAMANKDLFDFNPSPHSFVYFGAKELTRLFAEKGFTTNFFDYVAVNSLSVKQKILRPIKKLVVNFGLILRLWR